MIVKSTCVGGNLLIKIEYKNVGVNYTMNKQNVHDMKLAKITSVYITNLLINKLIKQITPDVKEYINIYKNELYDDALKIKNIIDKYIIDEYIIDKYETVI